MHSKPCRQGGAILVMTVIFLVVLLGFSALALDLGRLYVLRTEMQNAADASALAAAAELDGGTNAINDAVIAAKTLLEHQGRFADKRELLKFIKYDPDPTESALEFYSWINAEGDSKPDACTPPQLANGDPDENKCLASSDADAHYVKVKLHPALVSDGEDYYQISLYLLPVLGIFLDEGTALTASTSVTAVAGAGAAVICNYPPLFFCADKTLPVGTQVRLIDQGPSPTWSPGNFGYLLPGVDEIVVKDAAGGTVVTWKNDPQVFVANLADESNLGCTPATVYTDPGASVTNIRRGFNSRFGMYDSKLNSYKGYYEPALNVIDYPRDDCFTNNNCSDGGGRYGDGITDVIDDSTLPSTYSFDQYHDRYLNAEEISEDSNSEFPAAKRYNAYVAESSHSVVQMPVLSNDPPPPPPGMLWDNVANVEEHCNGALNLDCRNLDGEPTGSSSYTSDFDRRFNRRVLYVTQLDCEYQAENAKFNGLSGELDVFGGNPGGAFVKFFLTESVPKGGDAHVYAEYLGPVKETDEKYQDLVHTVIQLYE